MDTLAGSSSQRAHGCAPSGQSLSPERSLPGGAAVVSLPVPSAGSQLSLLRTPDGESKAKLPLAGEDPKHRTKGRWLCPHGREGSPKQKLAGVISAQPHAGP